MTINTLTYNDTDGVKMTDSTLTKDKKEKIHRFAFLKISCSSTLHTFACAPLHQPARAQAKECNLANPHVNFKI